MREVRGLGEDGEGGGERNDGRHDNDNDAMMMNDEKHALPALSQSPLPLPLPVPTPWTLPLPLLLP